MANGIDRLERLFSKKKYAAASREQQQAADYAPPPASYSSRFGLRKGSAAAATSPSSPTRNSPLNDMHFPQPSFIRPKAARMIPRDDHAYAPTSPSRPGTANRSMSVPEGPPTLPQLTATVLGSPLSPTRLVTPPRSAGSLTTTATTATTTTTARSPHGPPVTYQPRSMSVTSPSRRTFDSRRSSGSINYNYCSTSATLSSSGSSTMSASTHTSDGSSNHPNRRSSYVETPCELSDAAARAVPTNNGRILASVDVQRLPKRSSSLLQRRDVFVSPLANLDTYQISNTGRRDSVAITISSGEISPATVQATSIIPCSSPASPKENQEEAQEQRPELKVQGDELHELREMQGLSDDLQHTPPLKDLQQPLFFVENTGTEDRVEEVPASTSPKQSELPIFVETPLLRRDSAFAPIVLPQSRPTSSSVSAVSARRRSRLARRPMSLRYQRHLPIEPRPNSPSSVLMEPNLGDFLSLSDDDIAEDVAAAAAAAAAATAATADATSTTSTAAPVAEVVEEKKEEEGSETSTPRASMVPRPAETPAASTEDVPPSTPPKTPQQVKSALALQKPLPPAPIEAIPPTTSSPPVSPSSLARRRALAATAPSLPPAFQAPPPAFLSLLPGMPLLPSPMSVTPSVPAAGRPRTPAGEARMAAAFEIARIASQYKFDLAYIATIWPKNMAFPVSSASATASTTTARPQSIGWPSSPTSPSGASANKVSRNNSQTSSRPPLSGRGANRASHVSHGSHGSQKSFVSQSSSTSASASNTKKHSGVFSPVGMRQSKLEAQFLAAYGLATVRAPYSLSAPTHAKILNAERWLEFSEPDAQPDEFSRGYGCAFYPGRAPVNAAVATTTTTTTATPVTRQRFQRRPSTDDCDADTEQDARTVVSRSRRKASTSSASSSSTNNSGIVFVAYRRKEVVDERASHQEKDDLEALYRDVEALVGKILDVHMQQQRQAHPDTQRALPDVQDVLAAGGFPGVGAACTLRQSRFLGVRAA